MGFCQNWLINWAGWWKIPNLSQDQPNPSPRPDGLPCTKLNQWHAIPTFLSFLTYEDQLEGAKVKAEYAALAILFVEVLQPRRPTRHRHIAPQHVRHDVVHVAEEGEADGRGRRVVGRQTRLQQESPILWSCYALSRKHLNTDWPWWFDNRFC